MAISQINGYHAEFGALYLGAQYTNPVTVATGAVINIQFAGPPAVYAQQNWTIVNFGAITQWNQTYHNNYGPTPPSAGVKFAAGGAITNEKSGFIFGGDVGIYESFYGSAPVTVVNSGTIAGSDGIILPSGDITNAAGGQITGNLNQAISAKYLTLVNSGTITSLSHDVFDDSIFVENSGQVTNLAGGYIFSILASYSTYLLNDGTIVGRAVAASADNGGTISGYVTMGSQLTNSGQITGSAKVNAGAISNSGTIGGGAGAATIVNSGSISGSVNVGVLLSNTNLIDGQVNLFGGSAGNYGTIDGAVGVDVVGGTAVTVYNGGTIIGTSGTAVSVGSGVTGVHIAIDPGAVFGGKVISQAKGTSTLELGYAPSAGTLNGLGTNYVGFQSVTIDPGADWTIKGTKAGFVGVGIAGFASGDMLDFTDASYAAGDFAEFNPATGVVNVENSGGQTIATATLAGGANVAFQVESDGSGGVDVVAGQALIWELPGTYTSGVQLTPAIYGNPIFVTPTGFVSDNFQYAAVSAASQWTIINAGTIVDQTPQQPPSSYNNYHPTQDAGIRLAQGGSVTNEASGRITSYSFSVLSYGFTTIVNAGTLGSSGTEYGVNLVAGGTVTNAAGGSILGGLHALDAGAPVTIDNTGLIQAGNAIGAYAGGHVTNEAGGSIVGNIAVELDNNYGPGGAYVYNFGSINGHDFGVIADKATVVNDGTISSSNLGVGFSSGLLDNSGAIVSANTGVTTANGAITNASGALISGANKGINLIGLGSSSTIHNSGTISGGSGFAVYAYSFVGDVRLIDDPGAVIKGSLVSKAGGSSTIELTSAAAAGTIGAAGSSIVGFSSITIDAGASWTIEDTKAGFGGTTISGFGNADALDFTNVAYASGETVSFNSATGVGTILSGSTTLGTFTLAGLNAPGETPLVSNDGNGHVLIKLGMPNVPPVTTVPGAQTIIGAKPTAIDGISVADSDAVSDDKTITVVLSDGTGLLSATAEGGTVSGAGTTSLTLSGSLSEVNDELATLTYIATQAGADTIDVATSDGRGGSDDHTIGITVTVPAETWVAGKITPWSTATSWSAGFVPDALTDATLGTGTKRYQATIAAGQSFSVDALDIGGTNALLVIAGSLSVGGALTDTGGILLQGSASLTVAGALTGAGTLRIGNSSTLEVGAVASSLKLNFITGASGTLVLDDAAQFKATLLGFASGETIDLKGIVATLSSYSKSVLTLKDGTTTVATLSVKGITKGEVFTLKSDGHGGTDISLTTPPAEPALARLIDAVAAHSAGSGLADVSALIQPVDAISHGLLAAGH